MTTPIDEKSVTLIEKQVAPLEKRALTLVITTQEEQNSAGELLTEINRFNDQLEKMKKEATDPINKTLKVIRSWFKPGEEKREAAIEAIRKEMGRYQLEADKKAREEEAKIAARVGEGKGKLKPETAVRKMDDIARADQHIETAGGAGSVKFRTDQKLKIVDSIKLVKFIVKNGMYQMLDVDESAVLKALKQGMPMDGAELEEVRTVVNSR